MPRSTWRGWLSSLHRHRADPDLSAVVAFPSCRCGALLWPTAGAPAQQDRPPLPERARGFAGQFDNDA
jgi:hypothetical protein